MSRVWRLCPIFRAQPGACPLETQIPDVAPPCGSVAESAKRRTNSREKSCFAASASMMPEKAKPSDFGRCGGKAGQSRGVVRAPRRSHLPAVRAVSGIYEGVPNTAKNSRRALRNEKSPPFQGKRRGSTEIVRRDSALLRDAGLGHVWAAGQHLLHLTPTQEHR